MKRLLNVTASLTLNLFAFIILLLGEPVPSSLFTSTLYSRSLFLSSSISFRCLIVLWS